MATTTSLGFNIFSTFSNRGTNQAETSIQRLKRTANDASDSFGKFGGSLAKTMAIMAAPSAVPIVAGIAAITGGMLALGVTTAAAGGIFVATMSSTIKKTLEMHKAGEALTSEQWKFVTAVDGMKKSWQQFMMASADKTLGVARDGVAGFNAGIKQMPALIDAVYPSIKNTSVAFKDWMEGDGLKRFVSEIQGNGVPALDSMQRAGRDLLGFLGDGFRAFLPLGVGMAEALARGAYNLHQWADGGGFQKFIDNAMSNMPTIKEFFVALSEALKNTLKAFIELGPASLSLTTEILKIVATMSSDTIKTFFIAFMVAKTLYSTALAINAITLAVKLLSAAFIGTPIGWVVLAIGALIAIIVLIATKTTWFQDLWAKIWPVIKNVAVAVWDAIQSAIHSFVELWQRVWPIIEQAAMKVWDALKSAWASLVDLWNAVWPPIMAIAVKVWDALKAAWDVVWGVMLEVYNGFIVPLIDSWNTLWPEIKATAEVIWNWISDAWNVLWAVFSTVAQVYWDIMTAIWKALWPFIAAIATAVWDFLAAAWGALWEIISGIFNAFVSMFGPIFGSLWRGIVGIATAVWDVLKAAWNMILDVITAIFMVFMALFTGHWGAAWDAIKTAAASIWDFIVSLWNACLAFLKAGLDLFVTVVIALWNFVWDSVVAIAKGVWDGLIAAFKFFVDMIWGLLKAGLDLITTIWNAVWDAISTAAKTLWDGIVYQAKAFWDALTGFFEAGKNWILETFWNPLKTFFTETMPQAWDSAVAAIGKAWDSIKQIIRAPIQAVIDVVYNNGIVKVWNMVADAFGAGKLDPYTLPAFASGGEVRGPGTGTSDSITARLSRGEHVWTDREVRAAGGHGAVAALRSMVLGGQSVRTYGVDGAFADGGGVWDTIGSAIKAAFPAQVRGAEALGDLALGAIYPVAEAAINGATSFGVDTIKKLIPGENVLETMSTGMITKMGKTVLDWIKPRDVAPTINGSGGAGVAGSIPDGDRRRIIESALAAAGVPPPGTLDEWLIGMNTLITRESGWNPNAVNNWDINAQNGVPSGGLTQTIGPTFQAYRVPSLPNNVFDPIANVAASIRYIVSRYGSITNVQQANANLPPLGYAMGTPGATAGWRLVGERGPEWTKFRGGERVLPYGEAPQARGGSGGDHYEITIHAPGATKEAVRTLEQETLPKLRMMLVQQVGKK